MIKRRRRTREEGDGGRDKCEMSRLENKDEEGEKDLNVKEEGMDKCTHKTVMA